MALCLLGMKSMPENLYLVASVDQHFEKNDLNTIAQQGRLWIVESSKALPEHSYRKITGREKSYFFESSGDDKKPLVESYLRLFEPARVREDIISLSALRTREVGSDENYQLTLDLMKKIKKLGVETSLQCFSDKVCNVVAVKKGFTKKKIIVVAHFDSVGEEFAGADDNASGVAGILEMIRVLKTYKNQHDLIFLLTNAEELGLYGSQKFVSDLKNKEEIQVALNLDMIAYNHDGVIEFETSPEFEQYAEVLGRLTKTYTNLIPRLTIGAWGSDHVSFLNAGIPAVASIEHWETKNPCYHQACDTIDALNFDYLENVIKVNLSAILFYDQR